MKTKICTLMAIIIAAIFNYFLLTKVALTYEQIRALVLAEYLLIALFAYSLFDLFKHEKPEQTPEKSKTVTYLGDDYRVIYGEGCTYCHFYKACHLLEDFDVANRFQHATGTNCMIDGCYFKRIVNQ